ncbi:MAG TPA: helix-turn-helix transcriptional regulator [Aliidongia sp.]|uniref:helix-turn-helix transcriptional regulator n=1 Tax=Aliidongia sp. TaxID=1914230 RepID=UPI002DDCA63C|nr:helix-turn-helix transcriptional regulator [Aliidongia sp.]HEV2673715.1 helix-turn-helix transcriptional regulator [Aliidongia sp.]
MMDMIAVDRPGLGAFLVCQRAKLRPETVGLPPGGRRRTPGLRREEVAQLSGLGVTWYTWLEQGRDIQVSTAALDRIAAALRLDATERAHLFVLAGRSAPAALIDTTTSVSPLILRMIDGLHDQPAFVRNGRWDAVAWNRGAARLITDFAKRPKAEQNLIWLLFTDPWFRRVLPDWENDARRCIARFRTNFARSGGHPSFQALVDALLAASPEFRPLWRQHDVLAPSDGLKRFNHPAVGYMELDHTVLNVSEASELNVIVYSAAPGSPSAERLARLLAMELPEEKAA